MGFRFFLGVETGKKAQIFLAEEILTFFNILNL